ncbi:MAG: O-antigen ligase family protein [candidate division WOR-3 bacterium]
MDSQIKNQHLLTAEIRFKNLFFLLLLIFQSFFLTISLYYNLIYSLPVFLVLFFLLFLILGKNRLKIFLIFTIFFASLLMKPTSRKGIFLRLEEIPYFLLLFLTFLALEKKERYYLKTNTDYLLLSFLFLTGFSFFYGIFLGNSLYQAIDDFLLIFFYAFYFLVLIYFQEEKWQRVLVISIIVISVLVSLQYTVPFLVTFQIKRYATDQQHLFNIGYPLLISYIIFGKKTKYKILAGLSLIPMSLAVIISLTRALWITIPFSVFIILIIYFWQQRKLKQIFYIFSVFLVISLIIYSLFTKKMDFKKFIKVRQEAFVSLRTDLSLLERVFGIREVIQQFKKNPIFGVGLGSIYSGVLPWRKKLKFSWVDCLFINLLWKFGIIGFIIFLAIYYYFLKNIIKVFKNSQNNFQKWVSIGMLSVFISLIILSIESGFLLIYRFNLILASLLAIFNLWVQEK